MNRPPRTRLGCVFAAALLLPGAAQALDTRTQAFDPAFRTLKVQVENDFLSPPVITLGGDDRIIFSFDEIGDDFSELRFRLIHCNADWQPSQLVETEYLGGFNIADIADYAFSQNTFVHFVNYRVTIPSDDMQPLVSGNYLIQVFDSYDPDTVLLQARFSVSEDVVSVSGDVSGRTDRGFNTTWQQLELDVSSGDFAIGNPFADVKVTVGQNSMPESLRTLPPPSRMDGRRMVWQHVPQLIFPAGNEFRRFETVRLNHPGMHIDSMRYGGSNYHAWLMPDTDRAEGNYQYDRTQYGRFLVREYSATDSDLGADYVTVHFTLDFPELVNGDIYLDGELTQHLRDDRYRMVYDRESGAYTLEVPLKQGSYNYRYLAVPRDKSETADPSPVEGDFYETSNEYDVRVYYRPPGSRADRLIGDTVIRNH